MIYTQLRALAVVSVVGAAAPQPASAYDIDCGIILCLAGGFPSGCARPYRTFIRRITAVPPKPPIGFCPMGSIGDLEMDDEHPERFDVMNSVIDDPDIARLLDSVKVEHYRFRTMCCRGRECDEEYPCTRTWYLDGDGSGFHARSIEGHFSGTTVRMIGLDGQPCTVRSLNLDGTPTSDCVFE